MGYSESIQIHAPRQVVFHCLTSREKMHQWMGGIVRMEFEKDYNEQKPVGEHFHQEILGYTAFDGIVTGYREPEFISSTISTEFGTAGFLYTARQLPDGTDLTFAIDWPTPDHKSQLAWETMQEFVKMLVHKQLSSLKELAEAEA